MYLFFRSSNFLGSRLKDSADVDNFAFDGEDVATGATTHDHKVEFSSTYTAVTFKPKDHRRSERISISDSSGHNPDSQPSKVITASEECDPRVCVNFTATCDLYLEKHHTLPIPARTFNDDSDDDSDDAYESMEAIFKSCPSLTSSSLGHKQDVGCNVSVSCMSVDVVSAPNVNKARLSILSTRSTPEPLTAGSFSRRNKRDSIISLSCLTEQYLNQKKDSLTSHHCLTASDDVESDLYQKKKGSIISLHCLPETTVVENDLYEEKRNSIISLHCLSEIPILDNDLHQQKRNSMTSLHSLPETSIVKYELMQNTKYSMIPLNCSSGTDTLGCDVNEKRKDSMLSLHCITEAGASVNGPSEDSKYCPSGPSGPRSSAADAGAACKPSTSTGRARTAQAEQDDSVYVNVRRLRVSPQVADAPSSVLRVSELLRLGSERKNKKKRAKSLDDGLNALPDSDSDDDYVRPSQVERWTVDDTYLLTPILVDLYEPLGLSQPICRTLPAQTHRPAPQACAAPRPCMGPLRKVSEGRGHRRTSEPSRPHRFSAHTLSGRIRQSAPRADSRCEQRVCDGGVVKLDTVVYDDVSFA